MILSAQGIKDNGAPSGETWYVSGEWHNENGIPIILLSKDRNKAKYFENETQAMAFNEKFTKLGQIDEKKPFKTFR